MVENKTNEEYYGDESLWGKYQTVSLEDIVTDYRMSISEDDYTAKEPRRKIIYQAKKAFREVYSGVVRDIKAVEIELGTNLKAVLPQDLVHLYRASWVDSVGNLIPFTSNNNTNTATEYLQDHNYELLFDNEGSVLTLSKTPSVEVLEEIRKEGVEYSNYIFTPNLNKADAKSLFGDYKVNLNEGFIQFTSEAYSKLIVIEYLSDGLFSGNERAIRVHKGAEEVVNNYIYYHLIKNRRNVPYNEKDRARKEYYNSKRVAKRRLNAIKKEDLLKVLKGAFKWIKE